ncbi:MAG: hypothetical protein AAB267_10160 [Candidatus Desantisbacteria bacterium]
MKIPRYILTKNETVRRVEKVEYIIEIPENVKNKEAYAEKQLKDNNYISCKVVDVVDSEMLDDEVIDLRK